METEPLASRLYDFCEGPEEILIEVRKILLQAPSDPLLPGNILHREDPRGKSELAAALIKDPVAKSMTQ